MTVRGLFIVLLGALVLAPSALAAPPTLGAVSAPGGKVAASWTLPAGGQVWTVEVATASAVDSDGYFLVGNVVDTQVFIDGTTSWTSDEVLAPGTYYIHASGWDKSCGSCQVPEWSAVKTFVVGGSSTGTTSTPAASTPAASPSAPAVTAPAPEAVQQPAAESLAAPATPEVAPLGAVTALTAKLKGNLATVAFRVCGAGVVSVKVSVLRGARSHDALVTLPVSDGGCAAYELRLTAPSGTGKTSVSVGGLTKAL